MGGILSRQRDASSASQIDEELHRLFNALDTDRDEWLSNDELAQLFVENGQRVLTPASVETMMLRYLTDRAPAPNSHWSFEEFKMVFGGALTMFHEIDANNDGFIDVDELELALLASDQVHPFDVEGTHNVDDLIARFDISHDGRLDFVEFFFLYDVSSRKKLADLLHFWTSSMICWSDSPLIFMPNNLFGSLLCGGLSGAVGRTCTAPLSRLLMLKQTNLTSNEKLGNMTRDLFAKEGVAGFWRGNVATLLKIVPSVAINLVMFDELQKFFKQRNIGSNTVRDLVSGSIAGTVGTVLTYPLDSVKARMQMAHGSKKGVIGTMRELPLKTLFRGMALAVAEIGPQTGLRFYLMMRARDALAADFGTSKKSYPAIVGSSIVGGVVAQAVTFPLALLRRVQQTTDMSARQCAEHVYRTAGIRGFFRGLPLNVMQIAPSVSIGFMTYEFSKSFFGFK